MEVPSEAQKLADEKDFEIKMYRIGAAEEQLRPPRLVRVAVVQNAIVRPTTDPVKEQVCVVWGIRETELRSFCVDLKLCATTCASHLSRAVFSPACLRHVGPTSLQ